MAVKTSPYFSKQCNGTEERQKEAEDEEERRGEERLVSPGWSYRAAFPPEEISRRHRGGPLHYGARSALIMIGGAIIDC